MADAASSTPEAPGPRVSSRRSSPRDPERPPSAACPSVLGGVVFSTYLTRPQSGHAFLGTRRRRGAASAPWRPSRRLAPRVHVCATPRRSGREEFVHCQNHRVIGTVGLPQACSDALRAGARQGAPANHASSLCGENPSSSEPSGTRHRPTSPGCGTASPPWRPRSPSRPLAPALPGAAPLTLVRPDITPTVRQRQRQRYPRNDSRT